MREMRIHGTYPYDSSMERWAHLKDISPEEAFELTQVPAEARERFPKYYPWINKGYIVLGASSDDPSLTALQAGFLEGASGELGTKNWPIGVQAVYLHDGKFSLIKLVK